MGTGGTISGVGRYLKEQNPAVQVVGADPSGSVYSGGSGRPYLVEGVGEDFWPETYDRTIADRVIEVSDADSFAMTRGWRGPRPCWSAARPAWPPRPRRCSPTSWPAPPRARTP